MSKYIFIFILIFTKTVLALEPIIILVGPPGSGKGTFSQFLSDTFNYHHISAGDMIRKEIEDKTELGQKISKTVEQGNYIDQKIMRSLIKNKIDICINNAGINEIKSIKDVSIQDIQRVHSVNLHAPFLVLSTVLDVMKREGWGRVVNIGSLWSILSRQGRAMYSSSKHGLLGLTVTAALEYAAYNVLVNMVSPGFVWTDLSKTTLSKSEKGEIERKIPVGRFAEPEEIANTVLFLCSDLNSYITGQNIIVDGGYICE